MNPADSPSSVWYAIQAKTVFAQGGDGFWSVGAVGGVIRDTGPVASDASSTTYYGKALLSLYPSEALEVDLNLGGSNVFGAGATVTAGAAVQYEVLPRATLLAEIFRDERGPGKFQLGARYAFIPSRLEGYLSYGNCLGNLTGELMVGGRRDSHQYCPVPALKGWTAATVRRQTVRATRTCGNATRGRRRYPPSVRARRDSPRAP